jgi:hypothetical protein
MTCDEPGGICDESGKTVIFGRFWGYGMARLAAAMAEVNVR